METNPRACEPRPHHQPLLTRRDVEPAVAHDTSTTTQNREGPEEYFRTCPSGAADRSSGFSLLTKKVGFDAAIQRRYSYFMKTLSPTQARANMSRWLDQAIAGQAIGITHKGRIVKLQPVPVTEDWAAEEYELTGDELDRAAANLLQTGEVLLGSGKTVSWGELKKRRKAP